MNTRHITFLPTHMGFKAIGYCTVSYSRRYRHIRLSFCWHRGLKLTSPKRLTDQEIASFLDLHEYWLTKIEKSLVSKKQAAPACLSLRALTEIQFEAIGYRKKTVFTETGSTRFTILEKEDHLELSGPILKEELLRKGLRKWLCQQADRYLSPTFYALAEKHGFKPKHVRWKVMSSRWGSCSSKGIISLNAILLFLNPSEIEYVLAHELCHLNAMDHSPTFYKHLASLIPHYRDCEKNLKNHHQQLPRWIALLHL